MIVYGIAGIFIGIIVLIAGIYCIYAGNKNNSSNQKTLGIIEIASSAVLIVASIITFFTDLGIFCLMAMVIALLVVILAIKKYEKKV